MAGVAAILSLVFGRLAQWWGKGPILVFGLICCVFVAFPFLVMPGVDQWTWVGLLFIYTMQGVWRSTFEGTLKATFSDYFAYEKEGAFANISLQNGMASTVGYLMTLGLHCDKPSDFCVRYRDGSLHAVLTFELTIVVTACLGIAGYWRASSIHEAERQSLLSSHDEGEMGLLENDIGVQA
jgi:MFS family permease